jgi:hypothetical protein
MDRKIMNHLRNALGEDQEAFMRMFSRVREAAHNASVEERHALIMSLTGLLLLDDDPFVLAGMCPEGLLITSSGSEEFLSATASACVEIILKDQQASPEYLTPILVDVAQRVYQSEN